jgi:hypothetical protein
MTMMASSHDAGPDAMATANSSATPATEDPLQRPQPPHPADLSAAVANAPQSAAATTSATEVSALPSLSLGSLIALLHKQALPPILHCNLDDSVQYVFDAALNPRLATILEQHMSLNL